MVRLIPSIPQQGFEDGPNIKLYPGALNDDIFKVLDQKKLESLPVKQIWTKFPDCRNMTLIRHLESVYNEYKVWLKDTQLHKDFVNLTDDDPSKYPLALELLKHYRKYVGPDFYTEVSQKGKEQGKLYGKLYADLIAAYPHIFPSLIVSSPYFRTRLTTHYFLKYIKGLDLDIDALLTTKKDMILGSFYGKDIVLKLADELRERDHGRDVAPYYLFKYFESRNDINPLGYLSDEENDTLHYYTSPNGGESQMAVNQRIKHALESIMNDKHSNVLIITHHLAILGALNTIFSGTINTFQNFDNNRKPQNGGLTLLSEIPKTESGQENKFRVSAYNLSLAE